MAELFDSLLAAPVLLTLVQYLIAFFAADRKQLVMSYLASLWGWLSPISLQNFLAINSYLEEHITIDK